MSFSSRESAYQRYVNEYCAPLVITACSAEAELICLRSGLLFHELLSAFGTLDIQSNEVLKVGATDTIHLNQVHLRFGANSEMDIGQKNGDLVETLLHRDFEAFPMRRLPPSSEAMKVNTPSGWNQKVEDLVIHSMAFHETEMFGHPLLILVTVSTADADPLGSLQELCSDHHAPKNMRNGQYDPNIQRVFVVLHDATAINPTTSQPYNVQETMAKIQTRFPSNRTKLLVLNSLPAESPNLEHPDLWSRWAAPRYLPHLSPVLAHPEVSQVPTHPQDPTKPVYGCRLSMDDFIQLRDFAHALFQDHVKPTLANRLTFLIRTVNETRKGMKNFLKGFLRKARDDSDSVRGAARYTFDRTESQILLLADTCFSIKDYSNALSYYRLVKEDFKADKSVLHLAHVNLMMVYCFSFLGVDNSSKRERKECIDQLATIIQTQTVKEIAQFPAHVAFLLSEALSHMHAQCVSRQSIIDGAVLLLHASNTAMASRQPLLRSLLTERAAILFLRAEKIKRFAFHQVLAAQRYRSISVKATEHSTICYLVALLIYDDGHWSNLKAQVTRTLIEVISTAGAEDARRAFLLLLKNLQVTLASLIGQGYGHEQVNKTSQINEVIRLFKGVCSVGPWGYIAVNTYPPLHRRDTEEGGVVVKSGSSHSIDSEAGSADENQSGGNKQGNVKGWLDMSVWELFLNTIPVYSNPPSVPYSIVEGLNLPALDTQSLALMVPMNGTTAVRPLDLLPCLDSPVYRQQEAMRVEMEMEMEWYLRNRTFLHSSSFLDASKSAMGGSMVLTEKYISELVACLAISGLDLLEDMDTKQRKASLYDVPTCIPCIPEGEEVCVRLKLSNAMPMDIELTNIALQMEREESVVSTNTTDTNSNGNAASISGSGRDLLMVKSTTQELMVSILPQQPGQYSLPYIHWNLGPNLLVRQALNRPGHLLQRTFDQRANRQRQPTVPLKVTISDAYPLLEMQCNNVPDMVLDGEIYWVDISLTNQGRARASHIKIQCSDANALFFSKDASTYFTSLHRRETNATKVNKHDEGVYHMEQLHRFPAIGISGTIVELPQDVHIEPGSTYIFGAWVRASYSAESSPHSSPVERLYSHSKLSLVAYYCKLSPVDGTPVPWENQITTAVSDDVRVRPYRSSQITFHVEVEPSISIESSVHSRVRQRNVKTVLLSIQKVFNTMTSNADDDSSNTTREGGEALLQPSLPSFTVQSIRCYGKVKRYLGTGMPYYMGREMTFPSTKLALPLEIDHSTDSVRPSELMLPLTETDVQDVKTHINTSAYYHDMSNSAQREGRIDDIDLAYNTQLTCLHGVMSSFVGQHGRAQILQKRIRRDRLKEQIKREETGPRSIVDVRKENVHDVKNQKYKNTMDGKVSDSNGAGGVNTTNKSLSENSKTNLTEMTGSDPGVLDKNMSYLQQKHTDMQAEQAFYAHLMACEQSVMLTLLWSCEYNGMRRQGLHYIPSISLHERLLVELQHELIVYLPDNSPYVRIPVVVEVQNVSTAPATITIDTIDFRTRKVDNIVVNKSLRWEGKLRYIDLVIPAGQVMSLPFLVIATQCGVFDLNHFVVKVLDEGGNMVEKKMEIQSFVNIQREQSVVMV